MKPRFYLILALLGLLLTAAYLTPASAFSPGQDKDGESEALMPCVAFSGSSSAIRDRRMLRVTDAETWALLWAEHRGAKLEYNALDRPSTPRIDFERYMVIASFRGEGWNCNGDFVVSVEDRGEDVLLRFDSATFQTSGPDGGGIRVTPYGIWVLPRIEKPIVVEENVQGLIGHPPIWKQQTRFDAQTPH